MLRDSECGEAVRRSVQRLLEILQRRLLTFAARNLQNPSPCTMDNAFRVTKEPASSQSGMEMIGVGSNGCHLTGRIDNTPAYTIIQIKRKTPPQSISDLRFLLSRLQEACDPTVRNKKRTHVLYFHFPIWFCSGARGSTSIMQGPG